MRITLRPNPEPVPPFVIGPGVTVPSRIEGRVTHIDGTPYAVELVVLIEQGRPIVHSLTVERQHGGAPVTNDLVRFLPVAQLAQAVVRRAIAESTKQTALPFTSTEREGLPASEGRDRLEKAAVLYRWATLTGQPPTAEVARSFEVSQATAGRLIRQARESGLLGQAIGTKAGER